jgi:tRNA nucleotidyltransferase (CCA-adding enzyme)
MLRRLRCSNATIHRVTHLMRHYLPMVGPLDSAARIREWLSEVGVESASTLFELHLAYARAARATETERYLQAARQRVEEEIGGAPPLELADLAIGGEELLALGVQEGPAIGILLHELHARVLEDPDLNDPGTLAELARELIEIGGLGRGGSSRR